MKEKEKNNAKKKKEKKEKTKKDKEEKTKTNPAKTHAPPHPTNKTNNAEHYADDRARSAPPHRNMSVWAGSYSR